MMDTRQQILEKNFHAMHQHGFQGLRADRVIKELGITKGAFYHYFSGKQEMGYCIVDEIIRPMYVNTWNELYAYQGHPIDGIIERIDTVISNIPAANLALGCPLNNLIQEMTPLDSGFHLRLSSIIADMCQAVSDALTRGQAAQQVKHTLRPTSTAAFVIASLEGAFSLAKTTQSTHGFQEVIGELKLFLQSLKAS